MNQELMNKAAKILWDAWSTGHTISGLPKDCRPTTRQSAYEIQKRIADLSQSAQIGWKIAATSKNGQKHIGASGSFISPRSLPFSSNLRIALSPAT